MTTRTRVGIAGTGTHVPERVMSNDDFAAILDTSDEWIKQRTGIEQRHWVSEGENTSDLSVAAARKALDAAGVAPEELDLIILGTLTPDHPLPSVACQVQEQLGAKSAGAFDVGAACTGFLTALHTGEAFIAAGRARNVLVIGAEALSRYVNMEDRTSCILFGDGAGAAVMQPFEDCQQGEILRATLGSDGSGFEFIHIPHGGSAFPHNHPDYDSNKHFITLRGRDVYRFAVTKMVELIESMCEGYDRDEIAMIVPHQVNRRIIESSLERLEWDVDRCVINIDKYGNTSAASVPLALHEAVENGRIKKGDLVVLVAFGAGLTWGASLLRW